jgi:hypothetical protein
MNGAMYRPGASPLTLAERAFKSAASQCHEQLGILKDPIYLQSTSKEQAQHVVNTLWIASEEMTTALNTNATCQRTKAATWPRRLRRCALVAKQLVDHQQHLRERGIGSILGPGCPMAQEALCAVEGAVATLGLLLISHHPRGCMCGPCAATVLEGESIAARADRWFMLYTSEFRRDTGGS